MNFDYEFIVNERKINPAIKLLHSDNFPFIISFLFLAFKKNNNITIQSNDLEIKLTDYIFSLRMKYRDEDLYPDKPIHYLERWADDGYLRRYYLQNNTDIAVYELTSSTEKVIGWLGELKEREFIGTDSRLRHILSLVKTLSEKTSSDKSAKLTRLLKRKEEIEHEIQKLQSGNEVPLTETQVKEYFLEARENANRLLRDFADVKDKFRKISQEIKEKQVKNYQRKGKLISDIFSMQDQILFSDQGQSFKAVWEFLGSPSKGDEFDNDLHYVCNLSLIKSINQDDFMMRLKNHLYAAASNVNQTKGELNEQLSKFLDEKTFVENRRVQQLISEIKSFALTVKETPPVDKHFYFIDEDKPAIQFIMDRPLWKDSRIVSIASEAFDLGDGSSTNSELLFTQHYIDYEKLRKNIHLSLKDKAQITLGSLASEHPITKGIAEIIGYFSVGNNLSIENKALIDQESFEEIQVKNSKTEKFFLVKIPRLIFIK